mmetsp:Transcript_2609/g.2868  ORF Transcript_2609/g.2868 Transcript_2609/m.2868 type:complete len:136 (+) Transcript_2609:197-604(+)
MKSPTAEEDDDDAAADDDDDAVAGRVCVHRMQRTLLYIVGRTTSHRTPFVRHRDYHSCMIGCDTRPRPRRSETTASTLQIKILYVQPCSKHEINSAHQCKHRTNKEKAKRKNFINVRQHYSIQRKRLNNTVYWAV